MPSAPEITERLEKSFPGAEVLVRDLTGTSDAFECRVTTADFKGLSVPLQHLKIYEALGPWIQAGAFHALSLLTRA